MSSTNRAPNRNSKLEAQQSDIVIAPDGTVHISFLWDDLRGLAGLGERIPAVVPAWSPPAEPMALLSSEYDSCRLCPKRCEFDRNSARHPRCGDALLRVSNVGLTLGDEPPIRGSRGSGAIMLAGCPLKCPSCHNPEKVANGEPTDAAGFFGICQRLLLEGAHNIQILSPTVHLPALRILLSALKSSGYPLPIVLKSSGYESLEELRKLEGLVDIYLPDLKFGSCSAWAVRAGVRNYFAVAREAIEEMLRQVGNLQLNQDGVARRGVLVRHMEAPLPAEEKREVLAYLESLKGRAAVFLNDQFVILEP